MNTLGYGNLILHDIRLHEGCLCAIRFGYMALNTRIFGITRLSFIDIVDVLWDEVAILVFALSEYRTI